MGQVGQGLGWLGRGKLDVGTIRWCMVRQVRLGSLCWVGDGLGVVCPGSAARASFDREWHGVAAARSW